MLRRVQLGLELGNLSQGARLLLLLRLQLVGLFLVLASLFGLLNLFLALGFALICFGLGLGRLSGALLGLKAWQCQRTWTALLVRTSASSRAFLSFSATAAGTSNKALRLRTCPASKTTRHERGCEMGCNASCSHLERPSRAAAAHSSPTITRIVSVCSKHVHWRQREGAAGLAMRT